MKKQLAVVAAILAAALISSGAALAHAKGITVAQAEAAVFTSLGGHQGGVTAVHCVGLGKPDIDRNGKPHEKGHGKPPVLTYSRFICHATGAYVDAYFWVRVTDHGRIEIKPVKHP